jgi:hypothetical protein
MDRFTATDMVASKHASQAILPTLQRVELLPPAPRHPACLTAEPIPSAPLILPETRGPRPTACWGLG